MRESAAGSSRARRRGDRLARGTADPPSDSPSVSLEWQHSKPTRLWRLPPTMPLSVFPLLNPESLLVNAEIEILGSDDVLSSCAEPTDVLVDALIDVLAARPTTDGSDEPIDFNTLPTAEANVLRLALDQEMGQRHGRLFLEGAKAGRITVFESNGPVWFVFEFSFESAGRQLASYTSADLKAAVFFKLRRRRTAGS